MNVMTCDVPKKVAEAAPPPEPATPEPVAPPEHRAAGACSADCRNPAAGSDAAAGADV